MSGVDPTVKKEQLSEEEIEEEREHVEGAES